MHLHRSVISFYLSLRLRLQGFAMDMLDIIFLTEILVDKVQIIYCLMKKIKNTHSYIYACNLLIVLLLMTSCSIFKEIVKENIVESITDPKTGTPVFTREYDTKPYQINIGEIIKARKKQKKKKKRDLIENYKIEQTDSAQKLKVDSTSKCKFTSPLKKLVVELANYWECIS